MISYLAAGDAVIAIYVMHKKAQTHGCCWRKRWFHFNIGNKLSVSVTLMFNLINRPKQISICLYRGIKSKWAKSIFVLGNTNNVSSRVHCMNLMFILWARFLYTQLPISHLSKHKFLYSEMSDNCQPIFLLSLRKNNYFHIIHFKHHT